MTTMQTCTRARLFITCQEARYGPTRAATVSLPKDEG